jgi:hypothetical protein
LTTIPIILPNVAPTAMLGMKIPAGTLHPYDTTTMHILKTVASNKELTICHWIDVLYRSTKSGQLGRTWLTIQIPEDRDALAEATIVSTSFAFAEQDLQALCHVYPEKHVEIADRRREAGESDGLGYAIFGKVIATKGLDLKMILGNKSAIQTLFPAKKRTD